jgi:hypothetical protein
VHHVVNPANDRDHCPRISNHNSISSQDTNLSIQATETMPSRFKIREHLRSKPKLDGSQQLNAEPARTPSPALPETRTRFVKPRAPSLRFHTLSSLAHKLTISFRVADNAALDLALQQHLQKLDRAERIAFEKAHQNISIEDLLTKVSEFDNAHNRKATCRRCAEPVTRFLRIIEQFMQGVAIGIQSYPEISCIVVGAVRIVVDVCDLLTSNLLRG